jgi:hypothetical protein
MSLREEGIGKVANPRMKFLRDRKEARAAAKPNGK